MSRAWIEPGDGEKKQHKVTIRCRDVEGSLSPLGRVRSTRLEITTNAEDFKEPFIMDLEGGEVFTIVIED